MVRPGKVKSKCQSKKMYTNSQRYEASHAINPASTRPQNRRRLTVILLWKRSYEIHRVYVRSVLSPLPSSLKVPLPYPSYTHSQHPAHSASRHRPAGPPLLNSLSRPRPNHCVLSCLATIYSDVFPWSSLRLASALRSKIRRTGRVAFTPFYLILVGIGDLEIKKDNFFSGEIEGIAVSSREVIK